MVIEMGTFHLPEETKFYLSQLKQLRGYEIVQEVADDEFTEFFGLSLRHPATGQKKVLWFYSDDEANGPGSFEIQSLKTQSQQKGGDTS